MLEERVDDALDEDEQPHNKREGEDGDGWVVDEMSALMAALSSGFSMRRNRSRTIIHAVFGMSMTHTLNDRW